MIRSRTRPGAADNLNVNAKETREHTHEDSRWRLFWQYLHGDRKRLSAALATYVVKHAPVWLLPIFTYQMISVIRHPDAHPLWELWIWAGIYLLLIVQNIPSHMLHMSLFSRTSRNVEARLRSRLVRRLQELSIAYHSRTESGRLQAKVLRDVEAVERLLKTLVKSLLPGILGVGFAMAVTLSKDPPMAAFFIIAGPAAVVLRATFRNTIRRRNRAFRQDVEHMSGQVSEMIDLIPVARAHGVEEQEVSRIDRKLQEVRQTGIELDLSNALFNCTGWVVFQCFRFLCLIVTCYLTYQGRMEVEEVVLYQGMFEMMLRSVSSVLMVYPLIATGLESVMSINEVLQCPDVERNRGKEQVENVAGEYVFENVSFSYDDNNVAAVRDLSLHVEAGESIAFVGESGAGKSTVMNLIIGFYRPTEGRILLDGHDMEELDLRTVRQDLAVVPQECVLFSGSVFENIAYGLEGVSEDDVWEALRKANADKFVDELPEKLGTTIGEHGTRLSGGQRQRLAIARAIIRDPRVVIFDEATSSLDVASEMQVQDAIDNMVEGRTVFIVAHRLSTIRRCNRVVVMSEGEAIEVGTPEELMALKGEFYRLKTLQTWDLSA